MVDILQDHLSCRICIEICSNAVETNCCSQLFCENCAFSLRFCPVCRAEPLTTTINKSIRRMIGSLPVECICGYRTTRADLKEHEKICPLKPIICSVANCGFSGLREAFLMHMAEQHSDKVIADFSSITPIRDCIGVKGEARIGWTGKYYCGRLLNGFCLCCNFFCGPGDGCNCQSCMRLDIAARALPKGYLVNRGGRIAKAGLNDIWYCGAMVMRGVPGCDGWCGPNNGPSCQDCQRLQAQVYSRYSAIVASWANP